MTQVNNNAESLSRELRKFKNIKSVDFTGLLSGNSESYVNLYRHLFCENNVVFSRYIIDKGYDLSSLNDYRFMEAIYKMMRDLFNLKPPINQNQFFTHGFTQRKLEMSTILATHIRKVAFELNSRTAKKTIQTQSLMKSSLKRPNSAPKATRVTEPGDEMEDRWKSRPICQMNSALNRNSKKTKLTQKIGGKSKSHLDYREAECNNEDRTINASSDSEQSNPANSYNFNNTAVNANTRNSDDNSATVVGSGGSVGSNFGGQSQYRQLQQQQPLMDCGNLSAYEVLPVDHEAQSLSLSRVHKYGGCSYARSEGNDGRPYDVNQYTPRSDDGHALPLPRHRQDSLATTVASNGIGGNDRVAQQLETVIARITLLEGRVQRMESRLDNGTRQMQDRQPASQPFYSGQNNQNYSQIIPSHNYHNSNKFVSHSGDKTTIPGRDSRNVISDFETNYQSHIYKNDGDRSYSAYGVNGIESLKHDSERAYPMYGVNSGGSSKNDLDYHPYHHHTRNTSGSYRSNMSTDTFNGPKPFVTDKPRPVEMNNSSRESSYRANSTKNSQPILSKIPNGIPPIHPTMKKSSDDCGFEENRHGKSNSDKGNSYIQSQTDRIASLLSDTQKMLRISDEEL